MTAMEATPLPLDIRVEYPVPLKVPKGLVTALVPLRMGAHAAGGHHLVVQRGNKSFTFEHVRIMIGLSATAEAEAPSMTTQAVTVPSGSAGAAPPAGFTRHPPGTGARGAFPASPEVTMPMIRRGSWLQHARRGEREVRRRIGRALARGGTGRKEVASYLESLDAWTVAADRYNHDRVRRGEEPLPKAQLCELIDASGGSARIDEPVRATLRAEADPDSGRVIFGLGPRRRLRQILAGNALEPFSAQLHPAQMLLQGGIGQAFQTIEEGFGEGFEWAVVVDIEDVLGSFDRTRLPGLLPFPAEFTTDVLCLEGVPLEIAEDVPPSAHARIRAAARRGLLQATLTSWVVAEFAMRELPGMLSRGTMPITYGPTVLLLARTGREAEAGLAALHEALARQPAGRMEVARAWTSHASDGVAFLGHMFAVHRRSCFVRPDRTSFASMRDRLDARMIEAAAEHGGRVELAWRHLHNWGPGFDLGPVEDYASAFALAELGARICTPARA